MDSWAIITGLVAIVVVVGYWLRRRSLQTAATQSATRMPDWVASIHEQLTGTVLEPPSPTANLLGDPLPSSVDEPAVEPEPPGIRGRLAILTSDEQVARIVRRYLHGMEGVTVEIVSDASMLASKRPSHPDEGPDFDLLLSEPGRVDEIPPSLVCPIVPIRLPIRRARLLAAVRAGLEAAIVRG